MSEWITGNGEGAGKGMIEVEVEHCKKSLNLKNEIVTGRFKEDGFYLEDGGELSINWDIVKWRKVDQEKKLINNEAL